MRLSLNHPFSALRTHNSFTLRLQLNINQLFAGENAMKRLIVPGGSAKREVRISDSVIYFYISTTLDSIECILLQIKPNACSTILF